MAKGFNGVEAQRLLEQHQALLNALNACKSCEPVLRTGVRRAADSMANEEVQTALSTMSAEELSKGKTGIRVKLLQDNGYNTLADLNNVSPERLAAIRGISPDAGYTITGMVHTFAASLRDAVKLRLSADQRTAAATALVKACDAVRLSGGIASDADRLLLHNSRMISAAMDALIPGTYGPIRRLFLSSETKKRAEQAYEYLSDMLGGSYGIEARALTRRLQSLQSIGSGEAWDDFIRNPVRFTNILEDIVPQYIGGSDDIYGLPQELALTIQEQPWFPAGLNCELRRYQEWGVKYILHQGKALLGDEMGLGKTVQAIAAMVSLRNTGDTHFMVVCPASVIANWCREITGKSDLTARCIHGSGRQTELDSWIRLGGVAVTNYETADDLIFPDAMSIAMLVVDEAHYIKNPDAKRTAAVKELCNISERLLFMTGTALENKVEEMSALIGILRPEIAKGLAGLSYLSAAPEFRKRIAPVYYRRKRADVLTELPDKIENPEWCTMGSVEEAAYENAVLQEGFMAARRVSWNVPDLKDSCKAGRMREIIAEAQADGRKIIVFSFFLDTLRRITELLPDQCLTPITGAVPPEKRQQIIDEFDNAPAGTVLPAQIQSGGTGLNIQSASVVILCEPQLKPSIENQAISRAYRMGQTRTVLVHRLLCENTVDEKITKLLADKQQLFDAFADESEAARESLALDEKTCGNIIKEEIERIRQKRLPAQTAE